MNPFDRWRQRFEKQALGMGLNAGVFALDRKDNYCNEHVQWLWAQYMRANGRPIQEG